MGQRLTFRPSPGTRHLRLACCPTVRVGSATTYADRDSRASSNTRCSAALRLLEPRDPGEPSETPTTLPHTGVSRGQPIVAPGG
jgi:hypothetical protein